MEGQKAEVAEAKKPAKKKPGSKPKGNGNQKLVESMKELLAWFLESVRELLVLFVEKQRELLTWAFDKRKRQVDIEAQMSFTKNLGDFQSAKVGAQIRKTICAETKADVDEGFKRIWGVIEEQVDDKLAEIKELYLGDS